MRKRAQKLAAEVEAFKHDTPRAAKRHSKKAAAATAADAATTSALEHTQMQPAAAVNRIMEKEAVDVILASAAPTHKKPHSDKVPPIN